MIYWLKEGVDLLINIKVLNNNIGYFNLFEYERERERAILVVGRIYMYINIDIIWEIFFLLGDYNIYVYLNYFRYIGILLY